MQSTDLTPNNTEDSTTLPLTQARTLGPGTHTVRVECNEAAGSDAVVEQRALSVVATG